MWTALLLGCWAGLVIAGEVSRPNTTAQEVLTAGSLQDISRPDFEDALFPLQMKQKRL